MIAYLLGVLAAMGLTAAAVLRWRAARRTLARITSLTVPMPGEFACAHCRFCHDLTEMGCPDECVCPRPCGRAWCTAVRRERLATTGERAALLESEGGAGA